MRQPSDLNVELHAPNENPGGWESAGCAGPTERRGQLGGKESEWSGEMEHCQSAESHQGRTSE